MFHVVVELTIVNHWWRHRLIVILSMTVHHPVEQGASVDVAILVVDSCLTDVSVVFTTISDVRVVFHLPYMEGKFLAPFKEEGHAVTVCAIFDDELRAF